MIRLWMYEYVYNRGESGTLPCAVMASRGGVEGGSEGREGMIRERKMRE